MPWLKEGCSSSCVCTCSMLLRNRKGPKRVADGLLGGNGTVNVVCALDSIRAALHCNTLVYGLCYVRYYGSRDLVGA
jgi:hypothetical protein